MAVDSLVGRLAGVSYLHGSPAAPSAPYPEGTLRVALFADPAGNVFGIWQETAASPDPP